MKTRERGDGEAHRRLRRRWEPLVAGGGVNCRRCGQVIEVGQPWVLGHDDLDRTLPARPEHRRCSRGTLGRNGHVPGAAWKLAFLEDKVVPGIVRCGRCGWRIRKGSGWTVGANVPEHAECEHEPCPGGPPGLDEPRLWSVDWGAPFDDD